LAKRSVGSFLFFYRFLLKNAESPALGRCHGFDRFMGATPRFQRWTRSIHRKVASQGRPNRIAHKKGVNPGLGKVVKYKKKMERVMRLELTTVIFAK